MDKEGTDLKYFKSKVNVEIYIPPVDARECNNGTMRKEEKLNKKIQIHMMTAARLDNSGECTECPRNWYPTANEDTHTQKETHIVPLIKYVAQHAVPPSKHPHASPWQMLQSHPACLPACWQARALRLTSQLWKSAAMAWRPPQCCAITQLPAGLREIIIFT